jgi:AraC family transcriptional regulator
MRVSEVAFPPLAHLAPHEHDRDCLAVVVDGCVDKTFARCAYGAPAATVLTMPAGERHEDRFGRGGARIVVVEPDPVATEVLRGYAPCLGRVTHRRDAGMLLLAARIARELELRDPVTPLAVEGLALELVSAAGRLGTRERSAPRWLSVAREFAHEHALEPIRVGDVAAAAGVHPVHLTRVFREHEGVPVAAYVRRVRLDRAAAALVATDAPLVTIASEHGFSDQSHFTRSFKRHTGLTPAGYRASARR